MATVFFTSFRAFRFCFLVVSDLVQRR